MTTWLVTDNASSTIGGSGVFAGGELLTLATGTGSMFPTPSSGQAFMLRIGSDANHETVTCTGRSGDVLTISAVANNWLAGIPVELNFNATLFAALVQRTELGTAASHAATDFDVSGAATGAVAAHVIALDPHGDRAFATSAIETALESVSGAVSSVAGKTGAVTLTHGDLTDWATATAAFLSSAPVASVAGKTGTVTLAHGDLSDWATATSGFLTSAPVASVAGKTGAVTLAHGDLTDWASATAAFLTSAPVASVAGKTGAVTLAHGDLTDWSSATSGFLTSAPVASVAGRTGTVTLTHSDLTDWSTATSGFGGGGGGALVKIGQVITSGSQSTVTFSSIPGTFTDLIIGFLGRVNSSATAGCSMYIKINGDSTSGDYWTSYQYEYLTSVIASNGSAGNSNGGYICGMAGKQYSSNAISNGEMIFHGYANSTFYKLCSVYQFLTDCIGTGENLNQQFQAIWKSTSPVTDLSLTAPGYTFENGSIFTLFGRG